MGDLYDISKYTDDELYNILDLNNPTDRELEARIVQLINRYGRMRKGSGYKLVNFFQNMYDHFFEFDNPLQIKDYVDQSGNFQTKEVMIENKKYKTTEQELQSTISFDYVKDKFGLNPLLKQTIKRIICIDSQYRDNKNTTLSTDFNFYLTEPLRDVVSLKLESIQIPLTWWTISKSYGSNFFYLKGVKDGINNELHDYKFEIAPGYYTLGATSVANNQKNIYEAINESISTVSRTYSDVSFGNTSVMQDSGTTKIIIDLQKVYNESNYVFDFINDYYNDSISNFFGYMNSTVYEPYSIYSNYNTELTNNIITNNNKYPFILDNSNNYFTILHYNGPENYTENSSVINNFKIKITSGTYYRDELTIEINKQLKNSDFLDSISVIERKGITNTSNIYNGYSYYQLKIKFNRFKVQQIPNSKIIVIFPDESKLDRNPVWTKQLNRTSAFFFDFTYNETNTIYGETESVFSSIQINPGTNIFLKCKNPLNYVSNVNTNIKPTTYTTNLNDYKIPIPAGNYSLFDFINILNDSFNTFNFNNIINATASIIESKLKINMDIIKKINNNDWKISFDKSSLLYKSLNIPEVSNVTLSNNNIFSGSFQNKRLINQTFVIDTSYILTFSPSSANNGNQNDKSYKIYIPDFRISKVYPNYILLLNDIENAIKQFTILNSEINEIQYPLSNSFITSNKRTDSNNIQFIDINLNVNIEYFLSENNYEIYFNDTTIEDPKSNIHSWYKLNIDSSYNLYKKKLQIDPNADSQNYSTIISNSVITLNSININSTNNQLKITMDPSCNINTPNNNFIITIPKKTYTKFELISYINSVFSSDPRTYGSYFSVYVKNNVEYVKLLLNINIIYTTTDYKLVFYDPYSFIKCFVGSKTAKNTTWDSTLGWMLGFRDYTEYELLESNQTFGTEKTYYLDSVQSTYNYQNTYNTDASYGIVKTNVKLSGDTNCTLITYTYFYIILDDYIQNHINDGLISISKRETNIELPSYSIKSTIKTCDPVSNTTILSSTTNTDGLTSKQIYALNQSLISKRNAINSISNNTSISDIFAMIPLRTGGIPNGSYYIETGGNLQNQERNYFGPVNIQRMSIKLVSHNGDVIDLNNTDWSFTFICEQLYRT